MNYNKIEFITFFGAIILFFIFTNFASNLPNPETAYASEDIFTTMKEKLLSGIEKNALHSGSNFEIITDSEIWEDKYPLYIECSIEYYIICGSIKRHMKTTANYNYGDHLMVIIFEEMKGELKCQKTKLRLEKKQK